MYIKDKSFSSDDFAQLQQENRQLRKSLEQAQAMIIDSQKNEINELKSQLDLSKENGDLKTKINNIAEGQPDLLPTGMTVQVNLRILVSFLLYPCFGLF